MLKQLSIDELKPGMMVLRVIQQNGPVKIRRIGMVKSYAMVKGLTEMGVMLVEVDEAQSVSLDEDETESAELAHENIASTKITATPTQRLMEKDKQSAAVDRQLSQQFHRSLFMPAIDEMPSKWRLFVQPHAILSLVAIFGFLMGLGVMKAPNYLEQALVVKNQANESENKATPRGEQQSDGNAAMIQEQNAQLKSEEVNNSDEQTSTGASRVEDVQANQANAGNSNFEASDELANTDVSSDSAVKSFQSINGIVLNEGETVLGYGADMPSQNFAGDTSDVDAQTNNGENILNSPSQQSSSGQFSSDLLRRVNQAAAQIEAEDDIETVLPRPSFEENALVQPQPAPSEPVIDLTRKPKTMPRIDQLPSGTLIDMPAMSFSAHMYASNPLDRWVRVNGQRLSEGDFIADGLSIVEIEPERIILAFRGETFSMNALSDW